MRIPLAACLTSTILVSTLAGQGPAWLKINVIEGEGSINNIRTKTGRDIQVEVVDEQENHVSGAEVTFVLPMDGPSGSFGNAEKKYSTTTDEGGRATTAGLRPNAIEGRFNIKVSASYKGREGSTVVSQTNTLAGGITSGQHSNKKIIIGLLVGAGAGGAILASRLGGKSSAPPPPPAISLSIGGITVAAPH